MESHVSNTSLNTTAAQALNLGLSTARACHERLDDGEAKRGHALRQLLLHRVRDLLLGLHRARRHRVIVQSHQVKSMYPGHARWPPHGGCGRAMALKQ